MQVSCHSITMYNIDIITSRYNIKICWIAYVLALPVPYRPYSKIVRKSDGQKAAFWDVIQTVNISMN
jgi:hypothetical protein